MQLAFYHSSARHGQGSYRNLTVVFQTFPGQNYFFFPDFSKHLVNKTLRNWLLNAEIHLF